MGKSQKFRSFGAGCLRRANVYMENTSVHGLRYIIDKDSHWIERIFWIITCGLCIFGTYTLFQASWHAYKHNAVSFVTQTTYLDWNTTFPAVSVCEVESNEKTFAFGNAVYGEDRNLNLDTYIGEVVFFGGTCFACSTYCLELIKCPENIFQLVEQVRAPCDELISHCMWRDKPFNCCTHFEPLHTESGLCYTINSLQTKSIPDEEKLELISNRMLGPGTLRFRAHEKIKVLIHSPEDVPYINIDDDEYQLLNWGSDFLMSFQITEIVNDPNLESVPIESRNCRFPHENPLKLYPYYSYSACVVECHAKAQMRLCGCYHHFIPGQTPSSNTTCNITGLICLTQHAEDLRSLKTEWSNKPGLICDCMSSCSEPEYKVLVKDASEVDPDLDDDDYATYVNISLESLPTNRFSRNVVRSKLDLVVSMGGTAGLFLGASLLSTVEVIYYCCIRSIRKIDEISNRENSKKKSASGVELKGNVFFTDTSTNRSTISGQYGLKPRYPTLNFQKNLLRDIYSQRNFGFHNFYQNSPRHELY